MEYGKYVLLLVLVLLIILFFQVSSVKSNPSITKISTTLDTLQFSDFSGTILINEEDQGSVTLWIVGGGVATLSSCSGGCADVGNPESGLVTFVDGKYVWTRKSGNTSKYTFFLTKIRASV